MDDDDDDGRDILDQGLELDLAGGELEATLKRVPARGAVYLMADAAGRPVQLLCVRNLRESLRRRLGDAGGGGGGTGGGGEEERSAARSRRRVDYRAVVRQVRWRRVDSALEADWVYLEAARRLFPESYPGMLGFRPAWFVQVDPGAEFPRYQKRTLEEAVRGKGGAARGLVIGPVEDKHAAARLMQLAEDAFDLCRYYNVLIEAPRGKACAYKEMGRCPAPCDGTVSMERYRQMVRESAEAIVEPGAAAARLRREMAEAAGALRFEEAGRLKVRLEQVGRFGQGAFRHARRLEDFAFAAVQRGPREGTAKVFLIVGGEIEEAAGLVGEPKRCADLIRALLARGEELKRAGGPTTAAGVERVGLVASHLFSAKRSRGAFVRLDELEGSSLLKAWKELMRQKPEEEEAGEGVVKELEGVGGE